MNEKNSAIREVIIIGSGSAGLAAAIYAARADLKPLVISGIMPGGQLTITTEVENYPGFAKGIMGPDLMNNMRLQADRFGTDFITGNAEKIDISKPPFRIYANAKEYLSKSVIIATGASAKLLGIESENRFMGKGVSACATCDGYFFRDKEIIVVGGGDTAIEEAVFLTKFASKVSIVHRRDSLRASRIMQEKAHNNEKIAFIWDSIIEEISGSDAEGVTGLRLKNVKTGGISELSCHGVFVAIGHSPNTDIFAHTIEMDEKGYIVTQNGTETNIKGVFAAGDVQDHKYRQAITAAGSGCMAALDAERYLNG